MSWPTFSSMLISAIRSATNRSRAGGARSGPRPGRGRAVPGPCTDMIVNFPPGAPLAVPVYVREARVAG